MTNPLDIMDLRSQVFTTDSNGNTAIRFIQEAWFRASPVANIASLPVSWANGESIIVKWDWWYKLYTYNWSTRETSSSGGWVTSIVAWSWISISWSTWAVTITADIDTDAWLKFATGKIQLDIKTINSATIFWSWNLVLWDVFKSGTPVANDFAKFTDWSTIEWRSYSEVRSDLGLVIGTNVQAYSADTAYTTTKLDDFATPDDNTDLNATTTYHWLLPKLWWGTTNFLRADGTWAAPSGWWSWDVSKVWTPVDSQIWVWTWDWTIEWTSALTYDTTTLWLTNTAPIFTLWNTTEQDTNVGRISKINFKWEQSWWEISTLASIQAFHLTTSDNERWWLSIYCNSWSDWNTPSLSTSFFAWGLSSPFVSTQTLDISASDTIWIYFTDLNTYNYDTCASIVINSTDVWDGTVDTDVTFMQYVNWTAHNYLVADADWWVTIKPAVWTLNVSWTTNYETLVTSDDDIPNKKYVDTPRVLTITSHATPTINTDLYNCVTITAQAEAITSMTTNLSWTWLNFQRLTFRIKDNGTARAITRWASFVAMGVALPTTTVISKILTVWFIYDTVTSKRWCVASTQEA